MLLTEDHCVARPDWVRTLVQAHSETGRSVVGGVVQIASGSSATDWLSIGYLTQRHPRSLVVAPEIRAAQRGRGPAE